MDTYDKYSVVEYSELGDAVLIGILPARLDDIMGWNAIKV
jgi:hypothetical protein